MHCSKCHFFRSPFFRLDHCMGLQKPWQQLIIFLTSGVCAAADRFSGFATGCIISQFETGIGSIKSTSFYFPFPVCRQRLIARPICRSPSSRRSVAEAACSHCLATLASPTATEWDSDRPPDNLHRPFPAAHTAAQPLLPFIAVASLSWPLIKCRLPVPTILMACRIADMSDRRKDGGSTSLPILPSCPCPLDLCFSTLGMVIALGPRHRPEPNAIIHHSLSLTQQCLR